MLTGSKSNVHPSLYGGDASEANGPYDPDRDATTLPLIRRAIERGVPLLAICRGIQEMNVALGGTLATEIQERGRARPPRARTARPGRALRDPPDRLDQAGHLPGRRLRRRRDHGQLGAPPGQSTGSATGCEVEAVAHDGTVEAVSVAMRAPSPSASSGIRNTGPRPTTPRQDLPGIRRCGPGACHGRGRLARAAAE